MLTWLYQLSDRLRHRLRARKIEPRLAQGFRGEDLAHRYLRRQGLTIVARNYRPAAGHGEIDLVAWDGDTLAIVEVKSRASDEFGRPDRNVSRSKEQALVRSARDYTRRAGVAWEKVRFDVISVVLADPPRIAYDKDVFYPVRTL